MSRNREGTAEEAEDDGDERRATAGRGADRRMPEASSSSSGSGGGGGGSAGGLLMVYRSVGSVIYVVLCFVLSCMFVFSVVAKQCQSCTVCIRENSMMIESYILLVCTHFS